MIPVVCPKILKTASEPLNSYVLDQLATQKVWALGDPFALALCYDERFYQLDDVRLGVDDQGYTRPAEGKLNARVATSVEREPFQAWLMKRFGPATNSPVAKTKSSKA